MKAILTGLLDVDFINDRPQYVSLDMDAGEIWHAWREEIFCEKQKVDTDAETSFLAKAEELLARIALTLHLIENLLPPEEQYLAGVRRCSEGREAIQFPDRLTGETMRRAEIITRWIMCETQMCYRRFGFIQQESHTDEILKIIEDNNAPMTLRDIGQKKRRYRSESGQELVNYFSYSIFLPCD